MGLFDLLFGRKTSVSIEDIQRGTLIDVRTSAEFGHGHHTLAKNIPLQDLSMHLSKIKKMSPPLYVCCASGGRSATAASWLEKQGINAINLGGWRDVPQQ